LAERALAEGGTLDETRITFLYRTVLARTPNVDEVKIVSSLLDKQRKQFAADPADAAKVVAAGESRPKKVAPDGETAAWTMVANLMLNLDETVSRN
jgi:hypothetical protein